MVWPSWGCRYDHGVYDSIASEVQREVRELKVVLTGLEAKGDERLWIRNQSDGDLDDGKLIDGLTGEQTIYKRRGYGNFDQCFGPFLAHLSAPPRPTRVVGHALRCAHDARVLISAWNPMVWPIWGFRYTTRSNVAALDGKSGVRHFPAPVPPF